MFGVVAMGSGHLNCVRLNKSLVLAMCGFCNRTNRPIITAQYHTAIVDVKSIIRAEMIIEKDINTHKISK
jgi:hypothetical protein